MRIFNPIYSAWVVLLLVAPLAQSAEPDSTSPVEQDEYISASTDPNTLRTSGAGNGYGSVAAEWSTALSSYSSELMEVLDIRSIEDIADQIPSLNFTPFSPGRNIVSLRGSSAGIGSAETNNSVAFMMDGVYLNRMPNLHFEAIDFDRIEVLRGPQNVLHGSNAVGGVVRLVSRKPDPEESIGNARLSIGDNLYHLSGYYSVPFDGGLAISVSGIIRAHNGLPGISDIDLDDGRGNADAQLRTQFTYESSGNLFGVSLTLNFASDHGIAQTSLPGISPIPVPPLTELEDNLEVFQQRNDLYFSSLSNIQLARVSDLNLILGIEYERVLTENISLNYAGGIFINGNNWGIKFYHPAVESLEQGIEEISEFISQEIRARFVYEFWDTTVGLWYYFDEIFREEFAVNELVQYDSYTQETLSSGWALFAHSRVSLGRGTYLALGGRYSLESKTVGIALNANQYLFFPSSSAVNRSAVFSPELIFGWASADRHHLYLKYTRTYGSISGDFFPGDPARIEFLRQESANNIELAYQGRFAHGIGLSLVLFRTDYAQLTYEFYRPKAFLQLSWLEFGYFDIANIPEAVIQGVELEFDYRASDYFLLELVYSFNDSQYRDNRIATPFSFDGRQMLYTPKSKLSLRLSGDVPAAGEHKFYWLLNFRASDSIALNYADIFLQAPARLLLDLRLSWYFPKGFELTLWIRNLSNRSWLQNAFPVVDDVLEIPGAGRNFTTTFKYHF